MKNTLLAILCNFSELWALETWQFCVFLPQAASESRIIVIQVIKGHLSDLKVRIGWLLALEYVISLKSYTTQPNFVSRSLFPFYYYIYLSCVCKWVKSIKRTRCMHSLPNPRAHNVLLVLHVLNINSLFFGYQCSRRSITTRELVGRGNGSPWQHTHTRIKTQQNNEGNVEIWLCSSQERWQQPESKHLSPGEHLLAIGFLELESGFCMQPPW